MEYIEIENEIEKIKERNLRVEADKAWELSWTRKVFIFIITYFIAGLVLLVLNLPRPWLSALVPAIAFVLSTLSLAAMKRIWLRKIYKK